MPVGYLSGDTTVFSNVSLGDDGRLAVSRVSSRVSIVANEVWGSTVSGGFVARAGVATAPTYAFGSEVSLGLYRSGNSTIALSYGTLNLFTQSARLSKNTVANATGLNIGELTIVFAASGISLIYSSGASYYIVGGSASSAAQA